MRIFGRDPALVFGFLTTLAAVLCAFVLHVSVDQQGWIVALVTGLGGVVTALITHDGQVAAILAAAKVALSLGISFGWHLDTAHQALLMSLVATGVAMFIRTQVTAPVPIIPAVTSSAARP